MIKKYVCIVNIFDMGRSVYNNLYEYMYAAFVHQSPKFKRESQNETPEFPFWGLNICVDFYLRDSKKMKNMKKLNKVIFHKKN